MVCPGHSFQSLSVGRWSSAEEPRASLSPGGAAQAVELTNWLPRGWIHWGDTLWGRLSLPAKGCWPFNRSDQRPRDFFLLWNHARKNLHAIFFFFLISFHASLSAAMFEQGPVGSQMPLYCLAVHCHSQWGIWPHTFTPSTAWGGGMKAGKEAWGSCPLIPDVERERVSTLEAPKCVWNQFFWWVSSHQKEGESFALFSLLF